MRSLKWIGLLLVLISGYPIAFQVAELVVSSSAYARYFPMEVAVPPTTLHGHSIDVTTAAIVINGRRIHRLGGAQALALIDLHDKRLGKSTPVVVEWRGGADKSTWQYRTVAIMDRGEVAIDDFSYSERASPPVRTVLARFVSPTGIGFFSDATQGWPTLLYPIIYPWLTGLGGLAMLLVSFLAARQQRRWPEVPNGLEP